MQKYLIWSVFFFTDRVLYLESAIDVQGHVQYLLKYTLLIQI